MASAEAFRDLVSGRRQDAISRMLRISLSLAEMPYARAMRLRNRMYDRRRFQVHHVGVPVVCVGNLTMGGTGKTPMVQYLANWYRDRDVQVAIVSRGYRASNRQENDEARELAERLPGVPHIQDPDRVAAARRAVAEHRAELILLDDGFQHRRLARDLDVVLIDALQPFGFGHVFPRGTLREPIAGLQRAHVVALTRADLVSEAGRSEIRNEAAKHAPHALWVELAHVPMTLQPHLGDPAPVSHLHGKRVAAFCGIGNPTGFRHTVTSCGAKIVGLREFPDHHPYPPRDLDSLEAWVESTRPDLVVCTHKDLVKIPRASLGTAPLRALTVELQVIAGEHILHQSLEQLTSAR